jgi:type VI secretion system protein ImpH
MAGPPGTPTSAVDLLQELQREAYRFDFYHTVRRLECLFPDKPRLGDATRAADDPIRLGQQPSMSFAPSELDSLEPATAERPARLLVLFFGLLGPNGPLPLHITEHARDRLRHSDDPTFARFLDLFHHRMLSLFYRAWANAQPTVQLDRPAADRFALYVGSLLGMGSTALRGLDAVPDQAKLYFAGHLGCQTRHAEGLEAILQGFLETPVRIQQYVGQWMPLPDNARWRLGGSPANGTLGSTTTAGDRIWDCQQKFRIVLGPVSYRQYQNLLPGESTFGRLAALVRSYVGYELDWDVNVILKKEEVPRLRLGEESRLGWNSWLVSRALERDPRDPILDPLARAA